jgi:hypothetical protein
MKQQQLAYLDEQQQNATCKKQQRSLLLEEHTKNMHVLDLQPQFYTAELRKLSADE